MAYDPHDDQRGTWPKPRRLADGTMETLSAFLERVATAEYGLKPSTTRKRTWQELHAEPPFETRCDEIFKAPAERTPGQEG